MNTVDVIVTPTGAANLSQLDCHNLTGHSCGYLPNGFATNGTPVFAHFPRGTLEEAKVLAVARAYQEATGISSEASSGSAYSSDHARYHPRAEVGDNKTAHSTPSYSREASCGWSR